MKVFWSWQSDTSGKIGRHFVRDALNAAIEQLKQSPDIDEPIEREALSEMHLDQDRKGISGSPDLARVILEKIEHAAVFVADVTAVGVVPDNGNAGQPAKKLINPNVAIELGYALHALSDRSFLMVMNTYYGDRADLPFDLQAKAGPIRFNLPPNADKQTIATAAKQLTVQFVEALKPFIGQRVESIRRERPFTRAEERDGPTRFRASGEALGIRDGVGLLDPGAGNEIFLAPGAAVSLRVMPSIDPGKKWGSFELRGALNSGIDLPTLLGPANGMYIFRAEDGVGTCVIHSREHSKTEFATFAFESGEIWAISTYPLKDHPNDLFINEIERMLSEQLAYYGRFLGKLRVQPPYRWIAALAGAKDRELQYPTAPGMTRIPGWGSYKCVSDRIMTEGTYDTVQSPINALVPFFEEIYNKCGMNRPGHLPR
ncbi:MAG TPA: hypothetical protein VFG62_01185 [Rhodopila sp.]|jgi:hypothetical protein|nr:hypothetical protein [Rhodopila sp.]